MAWSWWVREGRGCEEGVGVGHGVGGCCLGVVTRVDDSL